MCKYCTNDIYERENYSINFSNDSDTNNEDLQVSIEGFYIDVGASVVFQLIDYARTEPLHFGVAVSPHFSYCPFCGKKLEE